MDQVATLIGWEVEIFLLATFAIVVGLMLTGGINTRGLLGQNADHTSASPERVQLLLATLAAAYGYLSQLLKNPTQFPDVPRDWLLLLGGSHTFFLGRKFYTKWFANRS